MKRIVAVILALIVLCSLVSCGSNDNKPSKPDYDTSKPVGALQEDFSKAVSADKSAEEIANEVIGDERLPWHCMAVPVEEGWLNGFSEDITGFEEAAMFSPVIGSIPFVGYVFKLADGADVDAFMNSLKDKADLNWNICVSADDMACISEGNIVFFTMCPASFVEDSID